MTLAAGFDTLADVGKLLAAQVAEYRSTAERAGVPAEAMPALVAIATCDRVPLSELLEAAASAARTAAGFGADGRGDLAR